MKDLMLNCIPSVQRLHIGHIIGSQSQCANKFGGGMAF